MLTPDDVAEEAGLEKSYECSYVGMAFAYRDYLINKGVLTKLTADDVKEDIPLFSPPMKSIIGKPSYSNSGTEL